MNMFGVPKYTVNIQSTSSLKLCPPVVPLN
jgi:hypothetical protein